MDKLNFTAFLQNNNIVMSSKPTILKPGEGGRANPKDAGYPIDLKPVGGRHLGCEEVNWPGPSVAGVTWHGIDRGYQKGGNEAYSLELTSNISLFITATQCCVMDGLHTRIVRQHDLISLVLPCANQL